MVFDETLIKSLPWIKYFITMLRTVTIRYDGNF